VGLCRHLLVFGALVVNLWVGGDIVQAFAGDMARVGFEVLLILGYLWFVIGLGGPLRGEPEDTRPEDRPR